MSANSNAKMNLEKLLQGKVFEIPEYQRGYAWDAKQVKDLIDDLNALVEDVNIRTHYMGTVVVYDHPDDTILYKGDQYVVADVVDGQQRLTSVLLYLAVILERLVIDDEIYKEKIGYYLYYKGEGKLRLGNDERLFYLELLKNGGKTTGIQVDLDTPQKIRLAEAARMFREAVEKADVGILKGLYDAITRRLAFTYYEIEEKSEIGMTFELMNSRGKDLSKLELLKNYLMYWIYRNEPDPESSKELTDVVNDSWGEVYHQLGKSPNADEEQLLRVCWTLKCNHQVKKWKGYAGFKDMEYVPIRGFEKGRRENIAGFIKEFAKLLANVSQRYVNVLKPDSGSVILGEYEWLSNILHTGNVANFLPLLVASRMRLEEGSVSAVEYVGILKAVECFAYRVFLWKGSRSNSGKSTFYWWGKAMFDGALSPSEIVRQIKGLIVYYDAQEDSLTRLNKPFKWYWRLNLLRYTLYEYEKHLLEIRGHGAPRISWENTAASSTHEHIFPQTPKIDSQWLRDWPDQAEIDAWQHDIGNLMLTMDNSSYGRNEFVVKCDRTDGKASYRDSVLAQEHEVFLGYHKGEYNRWTCEQVKARHERLAAWIKMRWFDPTAGDVSAVEVDESEDEDAASASL